MSTRHPIPPELYAKVLRLASDAAVELEGVMCMLLGVTSDGAVFSAAVFSGSMPLPAGRELTVELLRHVLSETLDNAQKVVYHGRPPEA